MVLLQSVEQQQRLDLQFDGANAAKHAGIDAENRGGQQLNELTTLIPTVGDGRCLKHTRNEQSNVD